LPRRVSSLKARPRERVEVELDGEVWRTLPAEVVLRAGLDVGVELDRERARRLRRELRRHEAMRRAVGVIRRRDVSTSELDERLERAQVDAATRAEVVTRLSESGAVDDTRVARNRARGLAERSSGDSLIRHDLSARGISPESVAAALESLEPERARAERVVERRGAGPKTARYLAGKGFSEDTIESACGEAVAEDAPPAVF
jgi:SOS response regulatory protein OraA/RecX